MPAEGSVLIWRSLYMHVAYLIGPIVRDWNIIVNPQRTITKTCV